MEFCNVVVRRFEKVILLALVLHFASLSSAWGSGYAVYTQGGAALAQANAVTAHLDDPAAIFFNPALIGRLPGTQVQLGSTLIHATRKFDSDLTGDSYRMEDDHFPSTLYIVHQFSPRLSAGLGVFSPFGLGTEWGGSWEGRYIATRSDLTTFNINPVLCWQVRPGFYLAGGVDVLLLDATLEKRINFFPLPDGRQKFSGDGEGVGYNLGLLLDLGKHFTFGAHYRSEVDINIDGDAKFTLPAGVPPMIAVMLQNSAGETDVTLPAQAQVGLAFHGVKDLVVEVGARWEDWSSFERLQIDLDSGLSTTTERDWTDVFGFNIGGRYQLADNIALMAGYLYEGTPVPDSTFDPSIPSAKSHIVSAGVDVALKSLRLQLGYAFQKFQAREKDNTIGAAEGGTANGRYRTENHMIGLSLIYRL
jgi:long-chain fatty acid transport protein